MNYILIRELEMPITIRAFTVPDENGDFNIYVNSLLSNEAKEKSLSHEKRHIKNNDFASSEIVKLIEYRNI